MKQQFSKIVLFALSLFAFTATAQGATHITDPQMLVQDTATRVINEVTAHKAELNKNTARIYMLVENMVVPHFDFRRMSQAALGRFWRNATEDQKDRLTTEFKQLLVRTYAVALLNYSNNAIEYLPVRMSQDATDVQVPTKVSNAGGPAIPINYNLYRQGGETGAWKVYDVVIDGISLVSNYRNTFTIEVRNGGIDGLIDTLAKRNNELRG